MFRMSLFFLLSLAVINSDGAIIQGNPQGAITLVEVFDYQCPHCRDEYHVIEALIKEDPFLKVRLMPVAILNRISLIEASAAVSCTHYRGAFKNFHHFALTHGPLSTQGVDEVLEALHLNHQRFYQRMHDSATETQLLEGLKILKHFHLASVPLFLIYRTGNLERVRVLRGEASLEQLRGVITHAKSA